MKEAEKSIGGVPVHPLGIGTWGMGGDRLDEHTVYADYDNDQAEVDAIRYCLSRGQNHIDTAQLYGAGHTEEIVGQAIRGQDRSRLFLASKVWKTHAARRSAVVKAVVGMLRRLGTDYLDLLYTHAPYEAIPLEVTVAGLNDALEAGLTRAIGVSNFDLDQLRRAAASSRNSIAAAQLHYNLLERGKVTGELLAYCREEGIAVVAYRPVERRLLADRAEEPAVLQVASRLGCTPAQVALAWLIDQEGVIPIPKASRREHIDENLGALRVRLGPEERSALEGAGRE